MYQVLAVTALRHGLNSKELMSQVRAMVNIKSQNKNVPWQGIANPMYSALRLRIPGGTNLVAGIESLLFKSKGRQMDQSEIAAELGIKLDKRNSNLINSSLQLLDVAGLAKKLPEKVILNRTAPYGVWMHRAYKTGEIGYHNAAIHIFGQLYERPNFTSKLARPQKKGTRNTTGIFSANTINSTLKKMEKVGWVEITHTLRILPSSALGGAVRADHAHLTDYGRKLWEKYRNTKTLPEELRKILLGEKET